MYLPVPLQPDCSSAWLEAARRVDTQPGHHAYNVIVDVANPVANTDPSNSVVAKVGAFLAARDKSLDTIANTIFPQALYERHGASNFVSVFHDRVLPKVRKGKRWSGYYFERMTNGSNELADIISRMKSDSNTSLNKYELSIYDAKRDVDGSPYGGQCLSFLSFHLLPGTPKTLLLTAQYRNHYYIEKLLGNLIGLGRLMSYVASQTQTSVGALTVVSTHAVIDQPTPCVRADIQTLLA